MTTRTKALGKLATVTALALTAALALAACSNATTEASGDVAPSAMGADTSSDAYTKITADEAQALMDEGSVTVVDVRTPQEYADGHIPGALNIPLESIGADKPAELTDADAKFIVYCRTGVRSKQASDKLVNLGYQHMNDMGGIVDWHGEIVAGSEPGTR